MVELILYSIPAFVLLVVIELISYRFANEDDDLVGYEARDTRTSLILGAGNVVINVYWKFGMLVAYTAFYELTPAGNGSSHRHREVANGSGSSPAITSTDDRSPERSSLFWGS